MGFGGGMERGGYEGWDLEKVWRIERRGEGMKD